MTSKTSSFDVGARLASLRRLHGVSQRSVAERADLAPSYLSRIETGRIQPTFPTVMRILESIGSERRELFEPSQLSAKGGVCPVTVKGRCLLDSIGSEARSSRDDDRYTPRQALLIRQFGTWVKLVEPDRLRAMEILLGDWLRSAQE